MSSSKTTTTFGAPFGALTSKRGGALASRASSSVIVGGLGPWTGRTVQLGVLGEAVRGVVVGHVARGWRDAASADDNRRKPRKRLPGRFVRRLVRCGRRSLHLRINHLENDGCDNGSGEVGQQINP